MLKNKMLNKTPILIIFMLLTSPLVYAVHDYANALYLTTYYYGAQRCGNTGSWIHGACHVKDGQAQSIDLTGGWHDCGDHVTFGQTAPYAAGALIEGYLMYPSAYEDRYSSANSAPPANGIPDVLDEAKIMTDLLIKCTTGGRFYYQKGNGDYDHKHMSEPAYFSTTYNVTEGGEKDGPRPMSFVTSGGSNMCGDAAAALALMAIAYQPYDAAYATTCFTKAKEVFAIGDTSPGAVASGSYYGAANYEDDMSWGAIAIYRASQARGAAEGTYLTKATTYANSANFQQAGYWPLCYDHTEELANYGLYVVTNNATYRTRLADEITYYKGNMDTCGTGQYAWITAWGSLRYAGNMAFAAMLYYKISGDATAYDFAKKNVDFALGTHGDIAGTPGAPAGRSFVVGYTNPDNVAAGSVMHPHHRAAFGKTSSADTDWVTEKNSPGSIAYKYVLKGALVGGPRTEACSNYNDNIDDYVANEVGVDYNAGLVGAIAGVKYVLNPSTPTRTPTPNLSMTRTFTLTVTRTSTITPTFTMSPVPPPTNKLNLEVMSQGSSDNCASQTFGFQYKITNWENTVINTTNMAIKVWVDTTDTISGSIYNGRKYDSVGLDLGTITAAISQGAAAGCAGATKSVLITITSTDIPANGGYIVIQGALERGGYQTPFDAGCNDYTKMVSTWTTYQNNTTQNLFQGTNLVCEYISNTTQDTSTGLNPCTLANGCGAATTPTRTPVITNTFTRTATYTSTRTATLVPPTATFTSTATRTNTQLIPSFTSTSSVTRTNTPTSTSTSTLVSSPTLTWTRTFTPTFTLSLTLTSTLTPGPSSTFTGTATFTSTVTQTFTRTNTSTPASSPTFTATLTHTLTGTYTGTRTYTPTFTNTVTQTSSRTFTPTVTPSFTATYTRTPSFTRTFTPTRTVTPTFTISSTHTVSPTDTPYAGTPTHTPTITQTFTVTLTHTLTATETFTMTDTDTVTETSTPSDTVTQTITLTATASFTPSLTVTFTVTLTVTLTETLIPAETFTETPSDTPTGVPTDTFTQSPTVPPNTFTATQTLSATDTVPSSTVTFSLTHTPTNTNTLTNTYTKTNTYTPTATNTVTTPVETPTSTTVPGTATPTPGSVIEVVTATPVIIYPNPNPTPGTTPGRSIAYTVNRPISKTVFKIYTNMGRLIRKAEDDTPRTQGKCVINPSGAYFTGLAKGTYYYVIIVTDQATGKDAKSPIEKFIVQ